MVIDLDKIFQDITKLKVGVIGDVMLDTYWWGTVDRISPEGPVPVVALTKKEWRIGGAGNVALNIKAMGADVAMLSVTGEDEEGQQLNSLLNDKKIDTRFIIASEKRMTTNKIRIIGRNQQMMRLDAERSDDLEKDEEDDLVDKLQEYITKEKPHVIILQDYNKGVLTENIIMKVIELCNAHNIISTADPKRKNFFSYKGVDLFKPNFKEVKESLHILSDDINEKTLPQIHELLAKKLHHGISLITLSEKGIFYQKGNKSNTIAAHVRNVADVSGAGDTVIAIASLLYAATKNIHLTAEVANIAGGIVCEEVGTAAINKERLFEECNQLLNEVQ
jgi:rfaE bifunctional protein kinase chain/domain